MIVKFLKITACCLATLILACKLLPAQVVYKFDSRMDLIKSYRFKLDEPHGIRANFSTTNTGNKITVSVFSKKGGTYSAICNNTPYTENSSSFLLYKAFITSSTNGGYNHDGETVQYAKKWWGFWTFQICRNQAKTESLEFVKYQTLLADRVINGMDASGWRPWPLRDDFIDVTVTLTIEGDVKLSDLIGLRLPGIPELHATDFVHKEYLSGHGCNGSNSGVCLELNNVRNIPDTNATDLVIQAHRGVWGKPNTNQENTIGAMIAAKNAGIKILESDIMPVNVQDGGNYVNFNSGTPSDLACFHDFILTRYTSETNSAYRIYNRSRSQLSSLSLKKPRSEALGTEKIMFFDELIQYAVDNDLIVAIDMKNLEPKTSGDNCIDFCQWEPSERQSQSLYHNLKFAINSITDESRLKHLVIKTYANYGDLKTALTNGANAVTEARFNKVLWAPIIAPDRKGKWDKAGGGYDQSKMQKYLDDWFANNESVLYYETNFLNDHDGKTSVMLNQPFCFTDANGVQKCGNILQYIYYMTGRRAGIFSEEPVGGKGTVNRWGGWNIKNPANDRRGDHLWLLKVPFFKHAVITTDRPDQWDVLKD